MVYNLEKNSFIKTFVVILLNFVLIIEKALSFL